MKYKGLPIYEITMDELNNTQGVSVMSIVNNPAVQSDFLKFSQEKPKYHFNDDKKIISGCALRADFPIYRENEKGEGFYVTFSPQSIYEFVQKFMMEARIKEVNIEHEKEVEGVYLFESYIVDERFPMKDEFQGIAPGSWMVSYKVNNNEVWKQIKEEKLKGFSVEVSGTLEEPGKKEDFKEIQSIINNLKILEQ